MNFMRTIRAAIVVAAAAMSVMGVSNAGTTATVEAEPIIVQGSWIPERDGASIADLGLFRWSLAEGFVPIPFQIDERVDHTFSPGQLEEFTENVHDVFGEEDGNIDGDDELVFLFSAAGDQAPTDAPAPIGADTVRHEIAVEDVTGEVVGPRYVYLFAGTGLATSPDMLVTWPGGVSSSIETETFAIDYAGPWLLVGYRALPPCGDGADLIDRLKGRAGITLTNGESEEVWNATSTFLGGIVGPVRAVRYVRGAASGVNTIHYDIVYPDIWERWSQLRVHPISNVWFYLDWLPGRVDTMYSSRQTAGVAIDGAPDSDPGTSVVPWELVRGPDGGLAAVYDVPSHPQVGAITRYTLDDENIDDEPISSPVGYTDDDDAAIGNHGVHLSTLDDTNLNAFKTTFRYLPLCGGIGDATMGASFSALWLAPPTFTVTPQFGQVSPVRDLAVRRVVDDLVLEWGAIAGAASYRVYTTDDPSLPIESWTLELDGTGTTFTDSLAALDPGTRFYVIAVVGPGGVEVL